MCLEQRDILSRLQEIQRGMASLMQHCGIKIHVLLGSSSNPIQIEDDEMAIQESSLFFGLMVSAFSAPQRASNLSSFLVSFQVGMLYVSYKFCRSWSKENWIHFLIFVIEACMQETICNSQEFLILLDYRSLEDTHQVVCKRLFFFLVKL